MIITYKNESIKQGDLSWCSHTLFMQLENALQTTL